MGDERKAKDGSVSVGRIALYGGAVLVMGPDAEVREVKKGE